MCFLDELATGLPVLGAPALVDELARTHTAFALMVFVAPTIAALAIEGPLLLLSDRWSRAASTSWGLWMMAASMLGCALAPSGWLFALAYCLYFPASGLACGVAQASLIEEDPTRSERAMARWTRAGVLGDLLSPLALWAATATVGWRVSFAVAAVALASWGGLVRRSPAGPVALEPDAEPVEPLWQALRSGLRNKRLLGWLFAASLCGLMDETLVSFGALLVRERIAADTWMSIAITMISLSAGGLIGLAASDRLLAKVSPLCVLAAACLGTSISYAAWLVAPSLLTCALSLFCVGVFVAPLYPITKAQAYREVPSRGGLVNAIGQVFTAFDVAVPLVLGLVADRFGLVAALAVLIAQPFGVAAIAAFARRRTAS